MTNLIALILAAIMLLCSTMAPIEPIEPLPQGIAYISQEPLESRYMCRYRTAEKKIIDTLLFKRLQSIKQLSVVNWVFPGSEHTRFIHSLGVMHIADKMALSLGLTIKERKLLRFAGLLHDNGTCKYEQRYRKGCNGAMLDWLKQEVNNG